MEKLSSSCWLGESKRLPQRYSLLALTLVNYQKLTWGRADASTTRSDTGEIQLMEVPHIQIQNSEKQAGTALEASSLRDCARCPGKEARSGSALLSRLYTTMARPTHTQDKHSVYYLHSLVKYHFTLLSKVLISWHIKQFGKIKDLFYFYSDMGGAWSTWV